MKNSPKMALVIGGKMGPPKPYDAPDEPEEHDFPAPEGMDMGEKKPGDMMEVVCTLEVKDNGMLCVRKVNGMEVPGYDDKEKPDEGEEKSSDTFMDAAMPEDEAGGEEQEAM
jgi:hypothetical protein